MRSLIVASISGIALVASGCGSTSAPPPAPPSQERPSAPSSGTTPPSFEATRTATASSRLIVITGTFTGHREDGLVTADQTVEVEVHWRSAPDDIHEPEAFTFVSGSYTFSESISGVCGGSRSEGGPLNVVGPQTLFSGEPQDRDQAQIVMVDRRLDGGGLEFAASSSFRVPNADASCDFLSVGGVNSCSLLFRLTALDRLAPDAECTNESDSTWTGRLEQSG